MFQLVKVRVGVGWCSVLLVGKVQRDLGSCQEISERLILLTRHVLIVSYLSESPEILYTPTENGIQLGSVSSKNPFNFS